MTTRWRALRKIARTLCGAALEVAALVAASMLIASVGSGLPWRFGTAWQPELAWAVGPVVGTDCAASWSAVTTNTDGSAVTGTITYNLYLATSATPAPVPGVTAPKMTGITTTSTQPCKTLASGQYYAWVTAVEKFAGSTSESAVSPAAPFVLVTPSAPGAPWFQ